MPGACEEHKVCLMYSINIKYKALQRLKQQEKSLEVQILVYFFAVDRILLPITTSDEIHLLLSVLSRLCGCYLCCHSCWSCRITCVQITEFPVEKLFNGSRAAAMHIFRISRRDGVD